MKIFATRAVDEVGRIVLPLELRRKYQIEAGTSLDICVKDNGEIILRKTRPCCKICGTTENLTPIASKNRFICCDCRKAICGLDA